jgi:hypothetical protein
VGQGGRVTFFKEYPELPDETWEALIASLKDNTWKKEDKGWQKTLKRGRDYVSIADNHFWCGRFNEVTFTYALDKYDHHTFYINPQRSSRLLSIVKKAFGEN